MNKNFVTVSTALALGLLFVPELAQRSSDEAPSFLVRKERWAVKTGADPVAKRIRLSPPQASRVAKLIQLERPPELPTNATSRAAQTTRYGDAEQTVYTVDADIIRY